MEKPLVFYKMTGAGNDFIFLNNFSLRIAHQKGPELARALCPRGISVGADGLVLLEPSKKADFAWRFFNADGSGASACGNGSRCAARLAHYLGIAGKKLTFETGAGIVEASVEPDSVRVSLAEPSPIQLLGINAGGKDYSVSFVDTGVPHAVVQVEAVAAVDVENQGRAIRFHTAFAPEGTNVTFMQIMPGNEIDIRTYERGVEGETLACGTGAAAAALVVAQKGGVPSPILVKTRSNIELKIHFLREGQKFYGVFLEGEARMVYTGELSEETMRSLKL
ncbi:MAG: diaminopimelate epimerase [Desulfatibacillaceae bacterium]|nr:diaminopimelate epimerase [Desulfatibacillaceae bacterium]